MKRSAGLWIDHREAVILFVSEEGETVKVIKSNVEKHPGRAAGVQSTDPYEALRVPADDRQQNVFTEHLNGYYDEVIAALHEVGSILILGPGEAKGELKKRIERSKSNKIVIDVEAADRMTTPQIAAKTREHFPVQIN